MVREKGGRTPNIVSAPAWGTHPAFVQANVELIRTHAHPEAQIVLTAHSLPMLALRAGDPYERLVRESADAIAERVARLVESSGRNSTPPVELAFQSQGEGSAEWLGPDLPTVLRRARDRGASRVAIAPFGFLGEHVETLYDLDIEARRHATELGLSFERVPALGTTSGLIDALEDLARRTLA